MNSTITLYKNCLVEKEKNFILDNSGIKAIETYLQTLESLTIENYQYIKQALSLSIKINASQFHLNMGENAPDLNYVKIQNDNQNACYYFIINKIWLSKETIELVLVMDTLNSYQYDSDYEISPKTLVKRMHKDRFELLTGSFLESVECVANTPVELILESIDYAHSNLRSINVHIRGVTYTNLEYGTIKRNYITLLKINFIPTTSGTATISVSYKVDGLLAKIDLKSEEINAPVYKHRESSLYDKGGLSMLEWSLYYKTADDQDTTPIDCFLIPSNSMKLYKQTNSGDFDTGNVPTNKYLLFFEAYNSPRISINANGFIFTPETALDVNRNGYILALAIFNDNGVIKFYRIVVYRSNGVMWGDWMELATSPNPLNVINSPAIVNSYEVDSLPSNSDIFSNQLYSSYYATHQTSMGSKTEQTIYGNNSIDKTLSTNIKIINIPYSPTPFEIDNQNVYTFDSCWSYDSGNGKMKLIDFNKRFINEISTAYPNIAEKLVYNLYQNINIWQDVSRTIKDPKLLHSDYYRIKFVYDSFVKEFPLEQVDFSECSKDIKFKFDFVMSRNIVSKFLFKFNQITYNNSKEDYDNIVAVSRNNEEVLYNSQFLNYIRTGYNYDLKAKERSEVASGIGIGLSVAGLLASIGLSFVPGGQALGVAGIVGSSIGLAGQIVNYAKTTAQNEDNVQRKLQESKMQAVSVLNADDFDLLYAYSNNKAKICEYEVSSRMEKVLDDLFFYCGYIVNEQMKPVIDSRRSFNFVQASLYITHTNNLTNEIMEDIKEKFEQGVTFLHYSFNKFDFNQDKENIERDIVADFEEE